MRVGERLFGLQWIIDQDDVGTASGEYSTVRGDEAVSLKGGDEFLAPPGGVEPSGLERSADTTRSS